MPTFIVTSRKKELLRRETEAMIIGARSTCMLALEDPLVAEEHCIIRAAGVGFVIEDCQTSTGTFVDGLAVDEAMPLADGQEIIVGVSRLRVECDAADTDVS